MSRSSASPESWPNWDDPADVVSLEDLLEVTQFGSASVSSPNRDPVTAMLEFTVPATG
jgi:hypothetical protein